MCLAVPYRVESVDGKWAEVDAGGRRLRTSIVLIAARGVRPGDYLLIHEDLAIGKVDPDDAKRIAEMVAAVAEENGRPAHHSHHGHKDL